MLYLLFSLLWFIVIVFLHAILHRHLEKRGYAPFQTVLLFPVGFIILLFAVYQLPMIVPFDKTWWTVPLPFTSLVIYGLLSGFFLIYFSNVYVGEGSPSGKIFTLLKERSLSLDELTQRFSNEELIDKRLKNLVDARLIVKPAGVYKPAWRGILIISFFDLYRRILGWDMGG